MKYVGKLFRGHFILLHPARRPRRESRHIGVGFFLLLAFAIACRDAGVVAKKRECSLDYPEPSSADSSTDSDIVFFLTSFKRLVDRFEPFSPGDLREELDAELHRDLPEAYNVEIKSQQGRLKDAISQLEEDTRKLRIYTAVLVT
jgi:hypothetical protein